MKMIRKNLAKADIATSELCLRSGRGKAIELDTDLWNEELSELESLASEDFFELLQAKAQEKSNSDGRRQ